MHCHRLFSVAVVGLLSAGLLAAGASSAQADSLKVLHHFDGNDGANPTGMILASDGNFYGAATTGGDRNACLPPDGCGTLFRMAPSGKVKRLHVFDGSTDGFYPSGLVEGPGGRLYGSTRRGLQADIAGGVLFSISLSGGDFQIHHRFADGSECCDGSRLQPGMVLATDGMFYGTTELGGDYRDVDHLGFGTILRLDPATHEITYLHSFQLDGNGIFPNGYVIQAGDGAIYGTTRERGSGGSGTFWKINTDGSGFQVVTQLPNMQTHSSPIQAADGKFYGTDDIGWGSVFKVDGGVVSYVNRFDGADGKGPFYPVTQLADGFLYGTTQHFGLFDPQGGDVFRLSTDGKDLRVLHSFDPDIPKGFIPNAKLIQGADGKLYGTTALGGKKRFGTVVQFDPEDLGAIETVSAPSEIKSGTSASGKVTLFKRAPQGGTEVKLSAGFGAASVPPSVTVPEGRTSAKFKIDTVKIGSPATIRIYGSVEGQGTRAVVIVNP